jgi:hypothetical protein
MRPAHNRTLVYVRAPHPTRSGMGAGCNVVKRTTMICASESLSQVIISIKHKFRVCILARRVTSEACMHICMDGIRHYRTNSLNTMDNKSYIRYTVTQYVAVVNPCVQNDCNDSVTYNRFSLRAATSLWLR